MYQLKRAIDGIENSKYPKGRKGWKDAKSKLEAELNRRGFNDMTIEDALATSDVGVMQAHDFDDGWIVPTRKNLKFRVMYIEDKSGGLEGNARIGKVYFSKSGETLYYGKQKFQKFQGYKANYFDVDTAISIGFQGREKIGKIDFMVVS